MSASDLGQLVFPVAVSSAATLIAAFFGGLVLGSRSPLKWHRMLGLLCAWVGVVSMMAVYTVGSTSFDLIPLGVQALILVVAIPVVAIATILFTLDVMFLYPAHKLEVDRSRRRRRTKARQNLDYPEISSEVILVPAAIESGWAIGIIPRAGIITEWPEAPAFPGLN